LWLPFYEGEHGKLTDEAKAKLLTISHATIDRLLKPNKVKYKRKGLGGTKPGSLLKNQIPIRTDNWDITKPGFCEADTVAHCGNSLSGDLFGALPLPIFSGDGLRIELYGVRALEEYLSKSRISKKDCHLNY
jgi:hypothetical protein